ncbi:MAG: MobF family relaxase [Solirubrobacteraceae bacterium]
MIWFTPIKSPTQAADYYASVQAAAEYYSDADRVPSHWLGTGAGIQALRGEVGRAALSAQLAGHVRDSSGDKHLGIERKGAWQHRAGWDMTVSAPKSVSLEILVHDKKDVDKAHSVAVRAVVEYLEKHAVTARINGQFVKTGNLTCAAYEHVSSRAGDPQRHTHLLISNVTFDQNGIARSVSNEQMLRYRRAADSVYQSVLSHELQKLGYAVRHDKGGSVEIADYTKEQLQEFSARSAEIEKALAARGLTRETASGQERQIAAFATRAEKNAPETRQAHADRWTAQAAALGIVPAARDAHTYIESAQSWDAAQVARESVQQAAAHLGEREAVFRAQDLHREAARFAAGRVEWREIESALADAERSGELIRGADNRLTTQAALESERETAQRLDAGRGDHAAVLNQRQFDRALVQFEAARGIRLSDEQRAAAQMILCSDDRFQGVQGLAGTGKTTLLTFVRDAAESKGWRVVGHSNGAEQAATMQRESGIVTTTTAAHILAERQVAQERAERHEKVPAVVRELRIMDEASQSGQRQYLDAIRSTEAAGARTVFLGDKWQHQSVESGRAFERSQKNMPVAQLGAASIRRQRTEHAKAAVSTILAGGHSEAIRKLPAVEIRTAQSALPADATRDDKRAAARTDNGAVIQKLAKDYAALSPDARAKTLVLTSTNNDRQALNSAIRSELQQRGELGQGVEISVLRKADLTAQEARRAESYTAGQVVEVGADYRREQLARGSRWTVADVSGNHLTLADAQGHTRTIDPAAIKLQAYDRETRAVAVGDRLRWTENHRAERVDHPLEPGLKVRNGASAIVEKVTLDRIHLRTAAGERIQLDAHSAQKLEHAYALTSHSAQGLTVDQVFVHHNVEAGAHSAREAYVNVTRARDDVTIYTQDVDKAARQSGQAMDKTAAHDIAPNLDVGSPDPTPAGGDHDHDRGGPEYEYSM